MSAILLGRVAKLAEDIVRVRPEIRAEPAHPPGVAESFGAMPGTGVCAPSGSRLMSRAW